MKKTAALLMTGMVCAAMAVPAAALEKTDVTGTWYGDLFGVVMTLELKEDGTYTSAAQITSDDVNEGSWEIRDDVVVMDAGSDSEGILTYEDGTLRITQDEMTIAFTKEPVEVFTPAEPNGDASLEDYAGTYSIYKVDFFDLMLDPSQMDLDLEAAIEEEKVTLNSASMELDHQELACTFEAGQLRYELVDEETNETQSFRFQLLKDGTLAITAHIAGEEMTMYAEKTEAEDQTEG